MDQHPKKASKILVVDDNPQITAILEQRLRKEGYETRTAANGFEIGWITHDFQPDLIFLDIMLPGINGIEICRQIRSDEKMKQIKIIGMSATEDRSMIDRMQQAGIDDFMPKPFALAEIKGRIVRLIGEPRPDASAFTHNRIFMHVQDLEWAHARVSELTRLGYEVALSTTLEDTGFRLWKFKPEVLMIECRGDEPWLAPLIQRVREHPQTKTMIVGAIVSGTSEPPPELRSHALSKNITAEEWRFALVSWIGPPRKRAPAHDAPRTPLVPVLSVLAVVLAIAAILFASGVFSTAVPPRSTDDSQDNVVSGWADQERSAESNKLVYYEGSWYSRSVLGGGVRITTAGGHVHEGFAREEKDQIFLRTLQGHQWIKTAEISKRETRRQPYEDYWDQAARLSETDAEGHFRLGQEWLQKGLKSVATREFRRALIADRRHAGARRALGIDRNGGR